LIPVASESIRVSLIKGNALLAERLLTRPASGSTTSADFDRLPVGEVIFRASALPNADGSGVAQAGVETVVPIVAGQVAPVRLTMASTIDHVEVMPAAPTVATGQTTQLAAITKNAVGEIVIVRPETLQWSSSNTAVATVDGTGKVTAVSPGGVTIEVRETESGMTASVAVTMANQTFNIGGKTYAPSGQPEAVTAAFTPPDGGVTVGTFKGYVLLHVTGVGQSYSTEFNDAFYLYTGPFFGPKPQNGHDGGFYQLTFGTNTLVERSFASNAKNFLVGSVPPYNPAHEYTVILDTKTTNPARLHFGVSDGGYHDNTGAYTIQVTQLTQIP
jgi:hypothetical protein